MASIRPKYAWARVWSSTYFSIKNWKKWHVFSKHEKIPEQINIVEEPVFNPDLSIINDPIEKPSWLYAKEVNGNIVLTNGRAPDANPLVFPAEEYKKIKSLLVKETEMKSLLIDTVELVNTKIDSINTLQYRIQMERNLTSEYHKLWVSTNDAFEKERKQHLVDNFIHRGIIAVTVVGSIALMAL